MATSLATKSITQSGQKNKQIIEELKKSYWMEIETVQNYLANSVNLDGVRAKEIKESLAQDVPGELRHAQQLAERIHVLGGVVPGSLAFEAEQRALQPPRESTDILSVIQGVIEAEDRAIEQYRKIIELCNEIDWVTQDLCVGLMGEEQEHRREFVGFLAEFDKEAAKKLTAH